jgi:hypothetical protein
LDSGSKYNDLANNSLKTLPNLKHSYLKRTYSIPNTFLKNRSKLPPKSIKVSCRFFTRVTGYVLECDRLLSKKCLVKFKFYFKVCKTI